MSLPQTLPAAIAQAQTATQAALAQGETRLLVELWLPEVKPMPLVREFLPAFIAWGQTGRVVFSDAGGAALARRDWGTVPWRVETLREPHQPGDQGVVVVAPDPAEVAQVRTLVETAICPVVLLNPRLEDAGTVGIGYAGRRLRQEFLQTLVTAYHLRPVEGGAVLRIYPHPWQIWREDSAGNYTLAGELPHAPDGETISDTLNPRPTGGGDFWRGLGQLLRALRA
ncbi:hypothetical protein GlitD10_2903 [Gloeomargarita lithophora Alchichica-D10]|uniref:DUF1995 domain-containing protein n=1 Tax=Gloeomargarita lithophora Alchichica-D10 TaxID=1188229 RepID=A0A1J0AH73_9CYAN|nr:DUF1995 family protein [Gloeomargarita lithophora]APB35248.1 hypothetical protein GlitD10_2903 [Gloeomargarita lithophora Alchichica-D10]